jgi:alpha,alpha-trehalase
MPRLEKILFATCLTLAMETTMTIPLSKALGARGQIRESRVEGHSVPFDDVLAYIASGWESLTRSLNSCKTFEDIKTDGEVVLYFPAGLPIPPELRELQNRCAVRLEHLPRKIAGIGSQNLSPSQPQGLLYLEHPYVVPGGQFNEMYGWDSYFIILGLLRGNHLDLAKGMVENFFFEIENYGGVLNANRTYYLTRSQPPFLSSMVLAVYEAQAKQGQPDRRWLERAYGFVVRDYEQWNQPPHLAGETGLSRYFDQGGGPVPEIMGDPSHYYRGVAHFFLIHEGVNSLHLILLDGPKAPPNIVGPIFPIYVCDSAPHEIEAQQCDHADRIALTPEFYEGDRSMRESGFDVSFRFGPFGAETHHYAAVCLNSLLYKTEKDLQDIASALGKKDEAQRWKEKALERRRLILKYLWDADRGLFFDYDFTTGKRSSYEYATTFYPLWAGLASKEQARAVAQNLKSFEQPGGLAMSRRDTQAQWDFPYGWAPIHLLAAEGLRRYGFGPEGDRIAYKFLATVLLNFAHDGTIREKYDVTTESAETHIGAGYRENVIGFGWTNGVFLELLNQLTPESIDRLKRISNSPDADNRIKSGRPGRSRLDASSTLGKESDP